MSTFTAQEDAARIGGLLEEVRKELSLFHKTHKQFHPGVFDGARAVPRPELLTNCRVLNDRLEIIRHLKPNAVFAELGTLSGDYITKIIDTNHPSEVHLFDFGFNNIRPENKELLDRYGSVHYHVGNSSEKLSELPNEYFDAIYIDADHSFDGVWKDLVQSCLKIKQAGYIICNDYTNFDPIQLVPYGVYAAVNKFANENDFKFEFLALNPWGFHDVALRKW